MQEVQEVMDRLLEKSGLKKWIGERISYRESSDLGEEGYLFYDLKISGEFRTFTINVDFVDAPWEELDEVLLDGVPWTRDTACEVLRWHALDAGCGANK